MHAGPDITYFLDGGFQEKGKHQQSYDAPRVSGLLGTQDQ